jgi:hypothetical protein
MTRRARRTSENERNKRHERVRIERRRGIRKKGVVSRCGKDAGGEVRQVRTEIEYSTVARMVP